MVAEQGDRSSNATAASLCARDAQRLEETRRLGPAGHRDPDRHEELSGLEAQLLREAAQPGLRRRLVGHVQAVVQDPLDGHQRVEGLQDAQLLGHEQGRVVGFQLVTQEGAHQIRRLRQGLQAVLEQRGRVPNPRVVRMAGIRRAWINQPGGG